MVEKYFEWKAWVYFAEWGDIYCCNHYRGYNRAHRMDIQKDV